MFCSQVKSSSEQTIYQAKKLYFGKTVAMFFTNTNSLSRHHLPSFLKNLKEILYQGYPKFLHAIELKKEDQGLKKE